MMITECTIQFCVRNNNIYDWARKIHIAGTCVSTEISLLCRIIDAVLVDWMSLSAAYMPHFFFIIYSIVVFFGSMICFHTFIPAIKERTLDRMRTSASKRLLKTPKQKKHQSQNEIPPGARNEKSRRVKSKSRPISHLSSAIFHIFTYPGFRIAIAKGPFVVQNTRPWHEFPIAQNTRNTSIHTQRASA